MAMDTQALEEVKPAFVETILLLILPIQKYE